MNIKYLIIILLIVAVIGIGIFTLGKTSASSNVRLPSDDANLPLSEAERRTIRLLAEKLLDDMDGLNVLGHNTKIYSELNGLNDKLFVAVYNEFNALLRQKDKTDGGKTLYEWIDSESGDILRNSILERMKQLKLD